MPHVATAPSMGIDNELSYSAASAGLVSLCLDAGRAKVSGITKK
jgi:hypothetical protein